MTTGGIGNFGNHASSNRRLNEAVIDGKPCFRAWLSGNGVAEAHIGRRGISRRNRQIYRATEACSPNALADAGPLDDAASTTFLQSQAWWRRSSAEPEGNE